MRSVKHKTADKTDKLLIFMELTFRWEKEGRKKEGRKKGREGGKEGKKEERGEILLDCDKYCEANQQEVRQRGTTMVDRVAREGKEAIWNLKHRERASHAKARVERETSQAKRNTNERSCKRRYLGTCNMKRGRVARARGTRGRMT